jgi:hypothetical protein
MEVISINKKQEAEHKERLLETIDAMRNAIENDRIKEFVATTLSSEGDVNVYSCSLDVPGAIGLLEIGKTIIIANET